MQCLTLPKKIAAFLIALTLIPTLALSKDFAKRYPNDTPMEVYTPTNPPPSGSDTPWTVDHNGNNFDLTDLSNLTVTGTMGSIAPPTSPSVSYSYASLLPPTGIVGAYNATGTLQYDSIDYPTISPELYYTVYAYTNINNFNTYSSKTYHFHFTTPFVNPGAKEVTNITTVADVAGSLNNKYFTIFDNNVDYCFWFNVSGGGGGGPGCSNDVEVDINTNASSGTIAGLLNTAFGSSGGFSSGSLSSTVTATANTFSTETSPADHGTGFTITVITPGVDPDPTIINFSVDLNWTAVAGATGYRVVFGDSPPVVDGTNYIYDTATNSINISAPGSEDFGDTVYPDPRPISDGVLRVYKLYSEKDYHASSFFSDTYTNVNVQDNNSGYQVSSELVSFTPDPDATSSDLQRPSDSYSGSTQASSFQIIGGNFTNIDLSNNQFLVNDLEIFGNNFELDGANQTLKVWGDAQFEKFHGVSSIASGDQSFSWGPGGEASGIQSVNFSSAGISAGDYGFVVGIQSRNYGIYGIAGGDNAYNYANGGIVWGGSSVIDADASRGVILGPNNHMFGVVGENGGAIVGSGNSDHGVSNTTVGTADTISGNNGAYLGTLITSSGDNAVGIGFNFPISEDNVIALGNSDIWMYLKGGNVGIGTTDTFDKFVVNGSINSLGSAVAVVDASHVMDYIHGYGGRDMTFGEHDDSYPTFDFEIHSNAAESLPQQIPLVFTANGGTDGLIHTGFGSSNFSPLALVSINDLGLTSGDPSFGIYDNDGAVWAMLARTSNLRQINFGDDNGGNSAIVLDYNNPSLDFYNVGGGYFLKTKISGDPSVDSYFKGGIEFDGVIRDAAGSAGTSGYLLKSTGSAIAWFNLFGTANTWTGQQIFNTTAPQVGTATASTIASFDGSKNLVSLPLATYPSFTELSYVKGVTSAIQTQLNAKGAGTVTSITAGTGLTGGAITTSGTINSSAVEHLSYQPGLLTAVNATIGVYYKASKTSTVDNLIGSAVTFSCIANPTITMYECGTSATCASSPVTIGTVTVTASGTATVGTVSNPAITAGDYIGWAMTAGTCASIDISATAQTHSN